MNYWLLCACASFAAIFLVAAVGNLFSAAIQTFLSRRATLLTWCPDNIFLIRVTPAIAALVVVAGLVIPAFLKFEPVATQEQVGGLLSIFALFGASAFAFSLFRFVYRVSAGFLLQRQWQAIAEPLVDGAGHVLVFKLALPGAVVATVGAFRPKIFVSTSVVSALTPEELAAAIAHEKAHVRTFDNLKRVLMHSATSPLFSAYVEQAWAKASELAADANAVAQGASPLDLASALLKVARMAVARIPRAALVASLVPAGQQSIAHRLDALMAASDEGLISKRSSLTRILSLFALSLAAVAFIFSRPVILSAVHELIEKLVR